MIVYSVKYRMRGQMLSRKLKKVLGDWFMGPVGDLTHGPTPGGFRCFELSDKRRIDIPIDGTMFIFSSERYELVRDKMSRESGHKI